MCFPCSVPIYLDDLIPKALEQIFSPHLYFLSIVGNDLVFSLEGSHPSSLLSVSQTSLVFFITHLLGKKLIRTKCQSCLKIFCRCSRKYQEHDRGQTLPVGEGLYNVLNLITLNVGLWVDNSSFFSALGKYFKTSFCPHGF